MSRVIKNEGRSPSLRKRRFYARYMTWVERIGYAVVLLVIGAFVYAFTARVDDVVAADGVELTPAFAAVEATGPTLVVRRIAAEESEVVEGVPLLEVVDGEPAALAYRRYLAARTLGDPALTARFPRPATRTLLAARKGTFASNLPAGEFDPVAFAEKAEIARVTDFGEIHAQASLAGDTAAIARAGGPVRIVNLAIPNPEGVTLRATDASGAGIAGRDLLAPETKAEIEAALKGQGVRVRNDALTVAGVSDVQIEARIVTEPYRIGTGLRALDLPGGAVLGGRVLSGSPVATAQLVDLPPALAARVRARVAALAGTQVAFPQGQERGGEGRRIARADLTGVRIKLKAEGLASAAPTMSAAGLKTTFDADVILDPPLPALIQALRDAARIGKPLTARVEMVTGSRPLAFLLLKRS